MESETECFSIGQLLDIDSNRFKVYGFTDKEVYLQKLSSSFDNASKSIDDMFLNRNMDLNFLDLEKNNELPKRQLIEKQIYTGNITLDFTQPLLEGTMNIIQFTDSRDLRKSMFIKSIISLQKEIQFIYLSVGDLKKEIQNLENLNFFVIKNMSDGSSLNEVLLKLDNLIERGVAQGHRIVLILDDLYGLFNTLYSLYHYSECESVYSRLRKWHTMVSQYKNGSFSLFAIDSILIKHSNPAWNKLLDKTRDELLSLSTAHVNFSNTENNFGLKNIFYGFDKVPALSHSQNKIMAILRKDVGSLIQSLSIDIKKENGLKELGFHTDPWDRYKILDSEYYLPILANNLFLSLEDQILLVHFVIFMVKTDQISYFEMPSNQLIDEYLEFCKISFLENELSVRDHLTIELQKPKEDQIDLISLIDSYAQRFLVQQQNEGKARLYKKDYFD